VQLFLAVSVPVGANDQVFVRSKIIHVIGNEASCSTAGGVDLSEQAPYLLLLFG
jgi:hypothetical protein